MLTFLDYTKIFSKILEDRSLSVKFSWVWNIWIRSPLKHVTFKLFLTSQVYISETSNGMKTA